MRGTRTVWTMTARERGGGEGVGEGEGEREGEKEERGREGWREREREEMKNTKHTHMYYTYMYYTYVLMQQRIQNVVEGDFSFFFLFSTLWLVCYKHTFHVIFVTTKACPTSLLSPRSEY